MNSRLSLSSKVIMGLYILVILGAISPFFWGSGITIYNDPAGSTLCPTKIPKEYQFLYDWVKESPPYYKTLIFPGKIPFSTTSSKHPAIYGNYYNQPPLLGFSNYFWTTAYGHKGVLSREITDNFGKILGLLNVKNIVIAPKWDPEWGIMPNEGRENIIKFLDAQKGVKRQEIYHETKEMEERKHPKLMYMIENVEWQKILESSKTPKPPEALCLYQNDYALPLIYGTTDGILIVGGFDALVQATTLGIDFSKWALFFANQLCDKNIEVLKAVRTIIFSDKDIDDLVLASVKERHKIDLWDFAEFASRGKPTEKRPYDYYKKPNQESGWFRFFSTYWTSHLGEISESKKGLIQAVGPTTDKPLNVHFDISKTEPHEIWLRVGAGYNLLEKQEREELSIYLDNVLLRYLKEIRGNGGLKWIKVADTDLTKGEHKIIISNMGAIATLDRLAIIPSEEIKNLKNEIKDIISDKELLFLYEGEKNLALTNEWKKEYLTGSSEGHILRTYRSFPSISWTFETAGSQHFKFAVRIASFIEPGRGNIIVSVDGKRVQMRLRLKEGVHGINTHWIEFEPLLLQSGRHDITICKIGNGGLVFDLLAIRNGSREIKGVFDTKDTATPVSWKKETSTKYTVDLPGPIPKFVVFNCNYHPLWTAQVGKDLLSSYQVNGWANGFLVNKDSGNNKLTVMFSMQKYVDLGFCISTIFFIVLGCYLFSYSSFIGSLISSQGDRNDD